MLDYHKLLQQHLQEKDEICYSYGGG